MLEIRDHKPRLKHVNKRAAEDCISTVLKQHVPHSVGDGGIRKDHFHAGNDRIETNKAGKIGVSFQHGVVRCYVC